MKNLWLLLEGDQTLGKGPRFWSCLAVAFTLALALGMVASDFAVENAGYFLVWTFMALGLSLMWGVGGTMSFGQTAFFGIGAYCYAILSTNWGADYGLTLLAGFLSLLVVGLTAAVIGYFIFFGRIRGVLVSIITLATTLGLETFLSQTAGPRWAIGAAELGGFNGISSMPPLTIPWLGHNFELTGRPLYFTLLFVVALVYLGLRVAANSRLGDAMVAVRENPQRAAALGYRVEAVLFCGFVAGSVLSGVSGLAFASWGQYISPDTMGLSAAALPIIWVTVSGRDFTATLIGTLALLFLSQMLAIYGSQYALLALSLIVVASILACPSGIIEAALCWMDTRRPSRVDREDEGPARLESSTIGSS